MTADVAPQSRKESSLEKPKGIGKKKAVLRFSVENQRGLAQGREATRTGDITTSMVCKCPARERGRQLRI